MYTLYLTEKRNVSYRLYLHTDDPSILHAEQWLLAVFGVITGLRLSYVASNLGSPNWSKTTDILFVSSSNLRPWTCPSSLLFSCREGKCGVFYCILQFLPFFPRLKRERWILVSSQPPRHLSLGPPQPQATRTDGRRQFHFAFHLCIMHAHINAPMSWAVTLWHTGMHRFTWCTEYESIENRIGSHKLETWNRRTSIRNLKLWNRLTPITNCWIEWVGLRHAVQLSPSALA